MVETLNVSLSGLAFSLLLYENVRSDYNQEGFLLGEIIENDTSSMTDNDEQVVKIDRVIKINSAIPCPTIGYFYNATGTIDVKKLESFLGTKKDKVVAWYKFKRSNAFKLTVREKIIHKNLAKFLEFSRSLFTCCLLTSSYNRTAATHSYSQLFVRYHELSFQNLPMHIINLSDPSHMYKAPEPCSETFSKLLESLRIDKSAQGVNLITKINTTLQKHTDELVEKLSKVELRMHELEREIKARKQKIKEKPNKVIENELIPLENGKRFDSTLMLRNISDNECNNEAASLI